MKQLSPWEAAERIAELEAENKRLKSQVAVDSNPCRDCPSWLARDRSAGGV